MKHLFGLLCVGLVLLSGCATLSRGGEHVVVTANIDKECKNLGPVTVSITGWGLPQESMNVLRNNVADAGGNTLFQTGTNSGIAYLCETSLSKN